MSSPAPLPVAKRQRVSFAGGASQLHATQSSVRRSKPEQVTTVPRVVSDPDLGTYVVRATSLFKAKGWSKTVRSQRTPPDFPTTVGNIPHHAARVLNYLRRCGCPVKLQSAPWDKTRLDAAIKRGPHQSADEHVAFLREEMASMIQKGQWIVLPYHVVRNLPGLRISPIGVVPQHDRRPRTIVDYSFYDINNDTLHLTTLDSMQFGRALDRILHKITHADPRHGPVYLTKVDIADGFYRVHLRPEDVPSLGVAFPPLPDGTELVAFPLVLPMGWVNSPPTFCAATETVADMANARIAAGVVPPPHRLDAVANTPPALAVPSREALGGGFAGRATAEQLENQAEFNPMAQQVQMDCSTQQLPPPVVQSRRRHKPVAYYDIYVDDFLGACQGSIRRRTQVRRILLHALDEVFRPVDSTDPATRAEPASMKKFLQGDGCWTTRKKILGWLIDTVASTIQLPERRLQRLRDILVDLPRTKRRIALKKWQQIVGELRSMSLAVPGLRGLFSLLQDALTNHRHKRVRLSPATHDFLDDIRWLTTDLEARPTRLREVVPDDISVLGATDAAATGMGGVFFVPQQDGSLLPCLWRQQFPKFIEQAVVSWNNPAGTLTNSDLELAGTIAQHDVMAHTVDIRERTIATLTDNTPALYRQRKGSITSSSAPAYLLRLQALHQRHHRYLPSYAHIAGPANQMADDCSRLWNLTDTALLAHFAAHYPQPVSWRLCHLRTEMNSAMISALLKQRCTPPSALGDPKGLIDLGMSGPVSAFRCTRIHSSATSTTRFSSSKSSLSESGTAATPKAVTPTDLAQYLTPFATWVRRSPSWGPQTLG